MGRDALNSVLDSRLGYFFGQCTDATGKYKNAEFLYADIKVVIVKLGGDGIVFIVVLDGPSVCKKVLALIDEREAKIFGQRCSTHGWQLLLKDISKIEFSKVLSRIVRLLKFVVNHSAVMVIFQKLVVSLIFPNTVPRLSSLSLPPHTTPVFSAKESSPDSAALLAIVDTRFGSNFYAAERVLRDKLVLERLFTCPELVTWVDSQRPAAGSLDIKKEFDELKQWTIFYQDFWIKLKVYVDFTKFMIVGLRRSDTDSPNLHLMVAEFDKAKLECVKMAKQAKRDNDSLFVDGFAEKVEAAFVKRRPDIVSQLSLAAAFVDPFGAYMEPPVQVDGGYLALVAVLQKYHRDAPDAGSIVASTMTLVADFREHRGRFFGTSLAAALAKDQNPDAFWAAAVQAEGKPGLEVCRYLVNGYAGQGASERMNQKVGSHFRNPSPLAMALTLLVRDLGEAVSHQETESLIPHGNRGLRRDQYGPAACRQEERPHYQDLPRPPPGALRRTSHFARGTRRRDRGGGLRRQRGGG